MPDNSIRRDHSTWSRHVWDDGRSIYGGKAMGSVQREVLDQIRRARLAQERTQQESAAPARSMSEELDARAASTSAPSSIADSGMGGSRATTAAQAKGGGGGTYNKYVATLKALRAGYPSVVAMMTGDRTPKIAFGEPRALQNALTQMEAHFAWEIEQRYKRYRANGGAMDMTTFINEIDYGQNRAQYAEQQARERVYHKRIAQAKR